MYFSELKYINSASSLDPNTLAGHEFLAVLNPGENKYDGESMQALCLTMGSNEEILFLLPEPENVIAAEWPRILSRLNTAVPDLQPEEGWLLFLSKRALQRQNQGNVGVLFLRDYIEGQATPKSVGDGLTALVDHALPQIRRRQLVGRVLNPDPKQLREFVAWLFKKFGVGFFADGS